MWSGSVGNYQLKIKREVVLLTASLYYISLLICSVLISKVTLKHFPDL